MSYSLLTFTVDLSYMRSPYTNHLCFHKGSWSNPLGRGRDSGVSFSREVAKQDSVVAASVPLEEEEEEEEEDEEEWEYVDETQIYLRSKFYESWLWMDVNLPSEADRDG